MALGKLGLLAALGAGLAWLSGGGKSSSGGGGGGSNVDTRRVYVLLAIWVPQAATPPLAPDQLTTADAWKASLPAGSQYAVSPPYYDGIPTSSGGIEIPPATLAAWKSNLMRPPSSWAAYDVTGRKVAQGL